MRSTEIDFPSQIAVSESQSPSFGETLQRAAQRWPDSTAIVNPETGWRLSYPELLEHTQAVAGQLDMLGLSRGDKVIVAAGNSITALELLAGALYGQYVPVPCNPDLGPEQLAFVFEHCDGEHLFATHENTPALSRALSECPRSIELIEVGHRLQLPRSDVRPTPESADGDALIIYTSGTTGMPKGVLHSSSGLRAAIENTAVSYRLSAEDRFLCVLPVHHGNSIHKVLATWFTGGTVVLPPRFEVRRFWQWVDRHRCTWLALVPSIISQLLKFGDATPHGSIRFARCSSAPLPATWHRQFEGKFGIPLLEGMGTTEAGPLFSSPLPPKPRKIGSPGKSVVRQAVRIVDPNDKPLRDGEIGSILVRGPSGMKGYYKDPCATAAALTPDGWFRTGDLGYRDSDGFFFITGRAKEIVIKAGVNIALREIDQVLQSHPQVDDAASVGIDDDYLGEDIVAYAVTRPGGIVSESELLDFCADRLGPFKTPRQILQVAEIPRRHNGKLQRHLLRERFGPEAPSHGIAAAHMPDRRGFVAPRTPMEAVLARVWGEHLGLRSLGVYDDFFALGGYSLLAIRMLQPLRNRLGTALPLTVFFEHPNIAEQALIATTQRLCQLPASERRSMLRGHCGSSAADDPNASRTWGPDTVGNLEHKARVGLETSLLQQQCTDQPGDQIPPRANAGTCVLSFAQQRIWFMGQLSPESHPYNTGDAVRLRGPMDVEALESALNALVARHEILRASISVIDGEARQRFRDHMHIDLSITNLASVPEHEQEPAVLRLVSSALKRPYLLDREPLIRATLVRLGRDDHVFILCCHHIVTDGWSMRIILRELEILYRDRTHGRTSGLPALPIQYGDFATWQRNRLQGEKIQRETEYWVRRLTDVPMVLGLPTDHPRPKVLSHRGHRQDFHLSGAVSRQVREVSRQLQVSAFTTLSAAFAALLFRYSGQREFVIGLPFADRDRPELQYLVGLLLDTHVIRFSVSNRTRFRDLIDQTRSEVAESYAHSDLPFELVVNAVQAERDLGYMPLCQVMVNWREPSNRMSSLALEGLLTEPIHPHDRTAKFDLSMTFEDAGEGFKFEVEYSTDLFEAATIERMSGHFQRLLDGASQNPACLIGRLPLLGEPEQNTLLVSWNDTRIDFAGANTLHRLFEHQVSRTPDAAAIVTEDVRLSYRDLNARANQLAGVLQSNGVGPETVVGVLMDRGAEMIVALFAVLKACGAYLPLDPEHPDQRLEFMANEAQTRVILAQTHLRDRVPATASRVCLIEQVRPEASQFPESNPANPVSGANAAYVIYTSGSTGQPKGVVNTHAGIVNRIRWMQATFELDSSDRVLQKTPFSFDVSIWEIFWPLLYGARLVMAKPGGHRDAAYLAREITRRQITTLHFVPSMLGLFLEHPDVAACQSLKRVICSGETLPQALQQRFFDQSNAELHNLYGPTEAAVDVTHWQCRPDAGSQPVPIGRPIANTQIRILDAEMQPVPIGVPGELFIGGVQVARGYVAQPKLTAARFLNDPFTEGGRLYRTGDMARWRPDGIIEFLGRLDSQVKLRGYRIELEEIETVLGRHQSVQACAVALREDTPGDQRLVAYVVTANGGAPTDIAELRAHLRSALPAYMVPSAWVLLPALPLTGSGKLDRAALPEADLPRTDEEESSQLEQAVAQVWRDVLGTGDVGPHSDFFEHGGHSLSAIRIAGRLGAAFGIEVPLAIIFNAPTVREQAHWLEQQSAGRGNTSR